MKHLLLAWLVLLGATASFAQDPATTVNLEAQKMAAAMRAGDYEKLATYTPRQASEPPGNKEAVVNTIKQAVDGMKAQGFTFQDVEIGLPGPVEKMGDWLVSIVPQKVMLKAPGGRLVSEAYLVGISEDDGKSWVFADSAFFTKENEAKMAQLFPPLVGKLHLPERKPPVFTKE